MKIAVAQINTTVGDFAGNAQKIRHAVDAARAAGSRVVVAPEMALSGYPAEDLWLRDEFCEAGKGPLFDRLKVFLLGSSDRVPYARVAAEVGLSEGAVKVAVHRLRGRYRELLRAEIGRTVGDPEQVEEEIRDLFAALAP